MVGTRRNILSVFLFTAVFCVGLPNAFSATKGQRVRSSPDIPTTEFSCVGRPPGYYADLETGCEVYHMCTDGGSQFSYRCPNTTLFQQRMLICAHWYQVNCSRAEEHYSANLLIGQRDKPFVDDQAFFSQHKQLKTLQNPDLLQSLGDGSARQAKSQSNNKDQANRVLQSNFKSSVVPQSNFKSSVVPQSNFKSAATPQKEFIGRTTQFANNIRSFSSTPQPFTVVSTTEDLSSLPLGGSVLPGGLKSFHFSRAPENYFISRNSQSTALPLQVNTSPKPSASVSTFPQQRLSQPASFSLPTSTANSIQSIDLFATTKSPFGFSSKSFPNNFNKFQPSGFKEQPVQGSSFFQTTSTTSKPRFNFQEPFLQDSSVDLAVSSQEHALGSITSTSTQPPIEEEEEFGGAVIPETDVKADIEAPEDGKPPNDKFNSFIKRFNPNEEAPQSTTTEAAKTEKSQPEYHTFINRFVPSEESNDRTSLVTGYSLEEQPGDHVFVNRFVLSPEELQQEKSREQVDKLHNLLPPDNQIIVNFPNFDLMPPIDDSDDSESNKIELHLQDPRSSFFIPSEGRYNFSKADAAPIIVTIPLHTPSERSRPMLFRSDDSEDACSRCHPSFVVNKATCMPCVIIR